MKKLTLIAALCVFFSLCLKSSSGQLLKRIRNEVQNRVENRAVTKSGNAADAAMDKAEDAIKNGASDKPASGGTADTQAAGTASKATITGYKNYDFVPGDKVIFAPDMSQEPDKELPARFAVKKGTAEIQTFDGDKILHLQANASTAVEPLMSSNHYLPEQFTLEFDMMYENPDPTYFRYATEFRVGFSKRDDANVYNGGMYAFTIISGGKVSLGNSGPMEIPAPVSKSLVAGNRWHHVAIYVRKNIAKAYIDQYRVCAVNTLPAGADKLYIRGDRYGVKLKNMRLAAGGDDKYHKIITEGKFTTHGILFDVNKASIKPASMGAINEIAGLMKAHQDLRFEIGGYTDADGNDASNMTLSQARAEAVRHQLISMGIAEGRLTAKGYGESNPIDSNDTAEGKANNRRVEFVKK